ncbi:MAG: NAD(P)-dependent alcohol dehydrogenase [Candidatus Thorarchaeota archaeon]|jgi:NADPH:quinone reductase-like Zn-dependent oxidoreductase
MKAMVTTKYGPIEVLEIHEREMPTPKENEVLIKVHFTTVSIGDVKMRGLIGISSAEKIAARLFLGWSKPKKDILGMEVAGEVETIGSDVTKFKVGDRVFASTFWDGLGGYAQYKCIPEDSMIARIPENMSYEQAVPVLGGGTTAAKILKKGNIQPGQKVLIYGASGNVGTYAVQIAKHLGAEVTGVCSTRNLELVKELGADKVIDYTTTDFTQSGELYDIVFDAVDKMEASQRKVSLKETGIYLSVGKDSGGVGKSKDHIEYLVFLKELMDAGKLESVIDSTYTFEQIPEAHKFVEQGRKRGAVVVTVD